MLSKRGAALVLLILSVLVAPILSSSSQLPQNVPTAPATTSPAATQHVTLNLIALDHKDRAVTDLKLEEFKVLEDNVEQKITSLTLASSEPLTIGLFFDTSNSRRADRFINEEAKFASEFVHSVWRQGDSGFVFAFDNEVTVVAKPTLQLQDIEQALQKIPQARVGGATAVYDALCIIEAEKLAALPGRKVYVVISDFEDNISRNKADQVIEFAHKAGINIFPIIVDQSFINESLSGFSHRKRGSQNRHGAETIAEGTGGEVLVPESRYELKEVFLCLTNDIRGAYRITYVSSTDGKKKRKIQIESSRPKLRLIYPKT